MAVRDALLGALLALALLLAVLAATHGLSAVGWVGGLASGAALAVAVARSAGTRTVATLGPADLVTVARATLACGAAALVASSLTRSLTVDVLVALAAVALLLDAVDGQVARRTRTASALGARLDGEADAFLMLVLSVHVALTVGWWVLGMGLVRYAFAAAGRLLPWMRAQLPPRYWRKVVTAAAGTALVVGVAEGAAPTSHAVLAVAALLLTESFGRDVWWLWRRRAGHRASRGVAVPGNAVSLVRSSAP